MNAPRGRPVVRLPGSEEKPSRNLNTVAAHVEYGYTLKEIADHLGLHYTTVSKVAGRQRRS